MARGAKEKKAIIRDLGDGLVLRRATPADTEALARFNCAVHCGPGSGEPPEATAAWVRDLMSGNHPTFSPGDFTVVEDTGSGEIVSSLNLISQTWSYGGVKFGVGRPELVGTKKEYRKKGLVRAQFDVIHEWSARRGEKLQAITGIPFFYRQFGYEMTLRMSDGVRGHKSDVPKLKKNGKEAYRVRPASEDDLSFIGRVYKAGMARYLVSTVRTRALWRYELSGRGEGAPTQWKLCTIENASGQRVGFLAHCPRLWHRNLGVIAYELKAGTNWLDVTPSVLRYLAATGENIAQRAKGAFEWIAFSEFDHHPVRQVVPSFLSEPARPYAYFIRVPDIPGFVRHVSPVLEERLARSLAAGYTGDLRLSFYGGGLRMAFKRGRVTAVEPWEPDDKASASFPFLTFLHILLGHHSLDDLAAVYPDSGPRGDEARLLLETLFPKMPSQVWGVE
ncbi:MAG: GNAT family N-acetyltransferase [Armatimonadetes bacterium]|nr:GNAT family N-acetyltransferase [Armatimonadota bacterium]